MNRGRLNDTTVACLVQIVVLFGLASAQCSRPGSQSDAQRASALIARAEKLRQPADLGEKARLYEQAAELLPQRDPRAPGSLRVAGLIRHKLGKSAQAMTLLEHSAELSVERGDITEAADTYVAALFIAREVGARGAARRFIDRAIVLTNSPVMPEAERRRILRRISQPAAELGALTPEFSAWHRIARQ